MGTTAVCKCDYMWTGPLCSHPCPFPAGPLTVCSYCTGVPVHVDGPAVLAPLPLPGRAPDCLLIVYRCTFTARS